MLTVLVESEGPGSRVPIRTRRQGPSEGQNHVWPQEEQCTNSSTVPCVDVRGWGSAMGKKGPQLGGMFCMKQEVGIAVVGMAEQV